MPRHRRSPTSFSSRWTTSTTGSAASAVIRSPAHRTSIGWPIEACCSRTPIARLPSVIHRAPVSCTAYVLPARVCTATRPTQQGLYPLPAGNSACLGTSPPTATRHLPRARSTTVRPYRQATSTSSARVRVSGISSTKGWSKICRAHQSSGTSAHSDMQRKGSRTTSMPVGPSSKSRGNTINRSS